MASPFSSVGLVTTALLQGRPRSTDAEAAENASARTTLRMVVGPVMVVVAGSGGASPDRRYESVHPTEFLSGCTRRSTRHL